MQKSLKLYHILHLP